MTPDQREALRKEFCKSKLPYTIEDILVTDYAEWLESKVIEGREWVSVKERLPKKMGTYITLMGVEPHMGTRVDVCFYNIHSKGWGAPILYDWATHEVTHWIEKSIEDYANLPPRQRRESKDESVDKRRS